MPRVKSQTDFPLGAGLCLAGAEITDEILTLRIFTSVLTEARRALRDGIVSSPDEADRALTRGLGFPREKGGIFPWAESVGAARLRRICRAFEALNPKYAWD